MELIIDRTPLKGLVNEIGKKIEDALGVNVLKDKVNKALGTSLQNLQGVVTSLQTQAELAVPLIDAVSCPTLKTLCTTLSSRFYDSLQKIWIHFVNFLAPNCLRLSLKVR